MRKWWIAAAPLLALALVGCGGKSSNKPIPPASLTSEQMEADVRNQKETGATEKVRLVSLPKIEREHSEAEESERDRRQQHGKQPR